MPKNTQKKLLTYARHKYVVERYKFWTNEKRRREDDVIRILMYQEVFLSETRIYDILRDFVPDPEKDHELSLMQKFKDHADRQTKKTTNQNQPSLFQ